MPTLPCTGGSHTAQEWQKFDQAVLAAALEDVTGIQHWVIEDGRDHGEPDKQRAVLRSKGVPRTPPRVPARRDKTPELKSEAEALKHAPDSSDLFPSALLLSPAGTSSKIF
jgi:hypothetical protein